MHLNRLFGLLRLCGALILLLALLPTPVTLAYQPAPAEPINEAILYVPLMAIRDAQLRTTLQLFNPQGMDAAVVIYAGAYSASALVPKYNSILIDEASFPTQASGLLPVTIHSSVPLEGVAVTERQDGKLVSLYRARPFGEASVAFGPANASSSLVLMNTDSAPRDIQVSFYTTAGLLVNTLVVPMVPPVGSTILDLSLAVSPDFSGTVVADAGVGGKITGALADGSLSAGSPNPVQRIFPPLTPYDGGPAYTYFGRAPRGAGEFDLMLNTRLYFYNMSGYSAAVSNNFYGADGSATPADPANRSFSLSPKESKNISLYTDVVMPSGLHAFVSHASTLLAFGDVTAPVNAPAGMSMGYYAFNSATDSANNQALLARVIKSADRNSFLHIVNHSSNPLSVSIYLYGMDGGTYTQSPVLIAGNSIYQFSVSAMTGLPSTFLGSAIVVPDLSGAVSVTVDEVYHYVAPCAQPSVSLSRSPAGAVDIGQLVQFTAAASGSAPLIYQWVVDGQSVGTNRPAYSASFSSGPHSVEVSVTNTCGSARATSTLTATCTAPKLAVSQLPNGVIYPTDPIHFAATPSGSQPIHYAWTADNQPVGDDSPILDQTMAKGNHVVSVTADNDCGQYVWTSAFTVVSAPLPGTVEVGQSTFNASTAVVNSGDRIVYTAILRNTGTLPAAGLRFDNPLPAQTRLDPGTASASDGRPVAFDGTRLVWSGNLEPGLPVVISYALFVSGRPDGDQIANTAVLSNPTAGINVLLTHVVMYRPGYTLKINQGRPSTNSLLVDLAFTYDTVVDQPQYYQLSNDGQFAEDGWLALQPGQEGHPNWALDPYGDPRLPRTVSLKFKASDGKEIGPFTAAILVDQQPPNKPSASYQAAAAQSQPAPALSDLNAAVAVTNSGAEWQVTTVDDNSGVVTVQISTRANFSAHVSEFSVTGAATKFYWSPDEPGNIYIRAVDRAGNPGPALVLDGFNFVWLPFINRQP